MGALTEPAAAAAPPDDHEDPFALHLLDAADRGLAAPAGELPHREQLEEAFGQDLSYVSAHQGAEADAAIGALGAEGFATGASVVLPSNPSIGLVAHEVTHVLQQHAGARLAGRVGAAGDPYEQEADEVAGAVERGESVAARFADGGASGGANGAVQLRRKGAGAAKPAQPAAGPASGAVSARWHAIGGTLFTDAAKPVCPVPPVVFRALVYVLLVQPGGDQSEVPSVEAALARPGREPYLAAFSEAKKLHAGDRGKLRTIKAAIRDLVRGGDTHEVGARLVAHHAMLSPHGRGAMASVPDLGIKDLAVYLHGRCHSHGLIEGGVAGAEARKAACEDLLDGLEHKEPFAPPRPVVVPHADAPASQPHAQPPVAAAAPTAGAAGATVDDPLAEETRQLGNYIREAIGGALGKALSRDELDRIELRIRAAGPRVRERVMNDPDLYERLVQSIDPTHGSAILRSLDVVEALYQQCRSAAPSMEFDRRTYFRPVGAQSTSIALLRPWFMSHPAEVRKRALAHPGLKKDIYAYLPKDQQRELARLAATGHAQPSAVDDLITAVEAGDGGRTVAALRAAAASDPDGLAALERDAVFGKGIARLDRPVKVGGQQLVPLQVCREMWGAAATDGPELPDAEVEARLSGEDRLELGVRLDKFVERVHDAITGKAGRRGGITNPSDYSKPVLHRGLGQADHPARVRLVRDILVELEREAATEPLLGWLRRERLTVGTELERRLEQRHRFVLRSWVEEHGGAGERATIARVVDADAAASTGVVGGKVVHGDEAAAPGKTPLQQAMHEILVAGRTLSEWAETESRALARAIARHDAGETKEVWQGFRTAALREMPRLMSLTGLIPTPIDLMRTAFRVHAGDLDTRVAAAFTEPALTEVRQTLHLPAVPVGGGDADGDREGEGALARALWTAFGTLHADSPAAAYAAVGAILVQGRHRDGFAARYRSQYGAGPDQHAALVLSSMRGQREFPLVDAARALGVDQVRATEQATAAAGAGTADPSIRPDDQVRAAFSEHDAEIRARQIWEALQGEGRIDVIAGRLLGSLVPDEQQAVHREFRKLSGGLDLTFYIREAMREQGAWRLTIDWADTQQQVAVGGADLTIDGSETQLEAALATARNASLDTTTRLRLAAGNGSVAQVQRVIGELDDATRDAVLVNGPLVDLLQRKLGARGWEQVLATLSARQPARQTETEEAPEPATAAASGLAGLTSKSATARLRALAELSFADAARLGADPALQLRVLQGMKPHDLALARRMMSRRSDAAGGAADEHSYGVSQAINRLRMALDQDWKSVLTQGVAIYQLDLGPDEPTLRSQIWGEVALAVVNYTSAQGKLEGRPSDAITSGRMFAVIRDAVLGTGDPSDELVKASIETVAERHARLAKLDPRVAGMLTLGPLGEHSGLKESSTVKLTELERTLKGASDHHVATHWTSLLLPPARGGVPMSARYHQLVAAEQLAAKPSDDEPASVRIARERFLQYVIELSRGFEDLLLPHMGDDRTGSEQATGIRTDRLDNKQYNQLAHVIRERIATLSPVVVADVLGITDPAHRQLLADPGDPTQPSANRRVIASQHALGEREVDDNGLGTQNLGSATSTREAYQRSTQVAEHETAVAQLSGGVITAEEDREQLATLRDNVAEDREAFKTALQEEAAWAALVTGTLASVLFAIVTAGVGTGLGPMIFMTALNAGIGSVVSVSVKERILDADFDTQDATAVVSEEIYAAVVNAVGSKIAEKLLSIKLVADRLAMIERLTGKTIAKLVAGAAEGAMSEVAGMSVEAGGALATGGDAGAKFAGATGRILTGAIAGGIMGPLAGNPGSRRDAPSVIAKIFDPRTVLPDALISIVLGNQPFSWAAVKRALLSSVGSNAISSHADGGGTDGLDPVGARDRTSGAEAGASRPPSDDAGAGRRDGGSNDGLDRDRGSQSDGPAPTAAPVGKAAPVGTAAPTVKPAPDYRAKPGNDHRRAPAPELDHPRGPDGGDAHPEVTSGEPPSAQSSGRKVPTPAEAVVPRRVVSPAEVQQTRTYLGHLGPALASRVHDVTFVGGHYQFGVDGKTHYIFLNAAALPVATSHIDHAKGGQIHFIDVDATLHPDQLIELAHKKLQEVTTGARLDHLYAHRASILVFTADDQQAIAFGAKIKPEPGYLDVIVHSDKNQVYFLKNGVRHELSPRVIARLIKKSGQRPKGIRLIACDAGHPAGVGQQIADKVHLPVLAANNSVWLKPDGHVVIGPDEHTHNGKFEEFTPTRSEERAKANREAADGDDAAATKPRSKTKATDDTTDGSRALELGAKDDDPSTKKPPKTEYKDDSEFYDERYVVPDEHEDAIDDLLTDRDTSRKEARDAEQELKRLAGKVGGRKAVLTGNVDDAMRWIERRRETLEKQAQSEQRDHKLAELARVKELREQLTRARDETNAASEILGGLNAMDYMAEKHRDADIRFPADKGVPEGGRRDEFDFIYTKGKPPNLTVIVIEAKGGGAKLGQRNAADRSKVLEQGSDQYMKDIADKMLTKLDASKSPDAMLRIVLLQIKEGGPNVHYLHSSAPIRGDGVVGKIREFKR